MGLGRVRELKGKESSLTVSDACFILQLIQEQTAPLFSLRALYSSHHVASSVIGGNAGSTSHTLSEHPAAHKAAGNKKKSLQVSADVDIASLDDFPPMSVSMQEKRYLILLDR